MKIKWNWGTGIALAIILFMISILYRVYLTTQNPVDLVEKDYYPKGLAFQDRIDEMENAALYKKSLKVEQLQKEVVLHLPVMNPDSSNLQIFRPSSDKLDIVCKVEPDSSMAMHFPAIQFQRGKYIIKLFWKEKGVGYYLEKNFFFK